MDHTRILINPANQVVIFPPNKQTKPNRTNKLNEQTELNDQTELQKTYQILKKPIAKADPEPVSVSKGNNHSHAVDIKIIGAALFASNMKEGNKVFAVSIQQIKEALNPELKLSEPDIKAILPSEYYNLIDIFSKKAVNELPPHRPYNYKITLEGKQTLGYTPLYNILHKKLVAVKNYIKDNLQKGFIEASQSPVASSILFVQKKDGSLWLCIDYRKLNLITKKDRYPLPLIEETLAQILKAKYFIKIDIQQAFHHIWMDPESEDLTTFQTRYGSYKYKVLPFGLINRPATFQHFINDVLFNLLDTCCTAYLDDILIYLESLSKHRTHIQTVLEQLKKANLQAEIKKCEFHKTET